MSRATPNAPATDSAVMSTPPAATSGARRAIKSKRNPSPARSAKTAGVWDSSDERRPEGDQKQEEPEPGEKREDRWGVGQQRLLEVVIFSRGAANEAPSGKHVTKTGDRRSGGRCRGSRRRDDLVKGPPVSGGSGNRFRDTCGASEGRHRRALAPRRDKDL